MADRRPERPVQREPREVRPKILARRPPAAPRAPSTPAPTSAAGTLQEARAVRARLADDFYRLGELLVVLAQQVMFTALGYDSFVALLEANDLPRRTTAFKLMAIARGFPRDKALAVGRAKAYALLRFAAEGGTAESVATADSVRTVNEAARLLREKRGRARARVPADALRHARRLRALAHRRGAIHARVRALATAPGEIWQRFLVPDDEADLLLRA